MKSVFNSFVGRAPCSRLLINSAVTSSRKAVTYEQRKEIFAKWNGTWLPRGSYGVYVPIFYDVYMVVKGSCAVLTEWLPYVSRTRAT